MIALEISYTVGGSADGALQRLTAGIERAGLVLQDIGSRVFPKIIKVLEGATAEQFSAEGKGPASGAWDPLSSGYDEWKSFAYPGQPIMVATGALREALTSPGPNSRREFTSDTMTYGTSGIPYASYASWARPVFDFGPDVEKRIEKAALSGIREAMKLESGGLIDFDGDSYVDDSGSVFSVRRGKTGRASVKIGGRTGRVLQDKTGRTSVKFNKPRKDKR